MPIKSKAQQGWLFANKPKMAKEWAAETPSIKTLPEKVTTANNLNDYFYGTGKKRKKTNAI